MKKLGNGIRCIAVTALSPCLRILPPWWKVRLYGRLAGDTMALVGETGRVKLKKIRPHGYEMELQIDDPMERFACDVGCYWGLDVIATIMRFLRRGDFFIDVGANLGFVTLAAARTVGPEGKVFSFEPSTTMAERLKNTVLRNAITNIAIYQNALGDQEAVGRLAPDDHPSKSNLRNANKDGTNVAITRADSIFAELPKEPWLLVKVDVEGYELRVLRGALSLLSRPKTGFIVEITESWLKELGGSADELFSLMQVNGYNAYIPKLNMFSQFAFRRISRHLSGEHHYDAVFLRPEDGWVNR